MREAQVERVTAETSVKLKLNLDGSGVFEGKTGVGFLDHMLHLLARHALIDLGVEAVGDLYVDAHHTVEDTGICLGMALQKALGDKKGINRYGSALIPMDEALALVALDLSGRPFLSYEVEVPGQAAGDLPVELVPEFFRAIINNAGITLHMHLLSGDNTHHIIEVLFKGFARALREAVAFSERERGIPSTKGKL
ncbi:MAG: imidazoleglycerol-phosphate dehydratase HisB [Thermacetogeniaceae bacterium]|nr:imidazoleglycerol-phosphate dehydratase HisB [Syntrophomonadaceae bacterium]